MAGGLHPLIKEKYFRVGHMGAVDDADILATVGAIESGLRRTGHSFQIRKGLEKAADVLAQTAI